jgi:hypothetical protein
MTVSIQTTNTFNTFDFWRNRTNELANAMSTVVITTGSTTTGNATVNGYFTANGFIGNLTSLGISVNAATINVATVNTATINTLSISTLNAGNVYINTTSVSVGNSSANISLVSPNTVQISNGQYFFASNGTWSLIQVPYSPTSNGALSNISTTTIIDSWLKANYNSAEYMLTVVDNTANNRQISRMLTAHDSYNALSTEYAVIVTNTSIGAWSVGANNTHLQLYFTPSSSNTSVRFTRTIV